MKTIIGAAPKLFHETGYDAQCRTVASRFLLGHVPVDESWTALGRDRQEYMASHANRYRLAIGDIDSMPTPPPDELDAQELCRAVLKELGVNAITPEKSDTQILTCMGAMFHDDLHGWDNSVFLNWYLAGPPRDFAVAGVGRVTIQPGDAMLFDPSRPHALLKEGQGRFSKVGWGDPVFGRSLFLSWDIELTAELEQLFDIERGTAEVLQKSGYSDAGQLQVMKATGGIRTPVVRKPTYLLAA
jgi:hypothetical protein